ncbi:hypothetical protein HYW32_00295 [Candidatus Berkelbacteria bacterium]|nr:hypothetical protein [Candidatus Berkelbacteria bacterium]
MIRALRKISVEWLLFGLSLILAGLILTPTFSKPTPPGADANTYIIDAVEAVRAHRLLPTHEGIAPYGRVPYESPLPVALLSGLWYLTGGQLDFDYPLFSLLELGILVAIATVLGLLAKRLDGLIAAIPILLATSFGMLFLINSATLANFLAFLIVGCVALFLTRKRRLSAVLLIYLLTGILLYLTHKSLSFMLFVPVAVITFFMFAWPERKTLLHKIRRKWWLIFVFVVANGVALWRWPELIRAPWQTIEYIVSVPTYWEPGPFREFITLPGYVVALGLPLSLLALFGLGVVIKKNNQMRRQALIFSVTWVLVSFALSFLPRVGFYFYPSRFLYESIPFLAVAGAIGLNALLKIKARPLALTLVTAILIFPIPYAQEMNARIATGSNYMTLEHLKSVSDLQAIIQQDEHIISNVSLVSTYFLSALQRPMTQRAIFTGESFFTTGYGYPIEYALLLKPDWKASTSDLDCVGNVLKTLAGVELIYIDGVSQLYRLNDQAVLTTSNSVFAECINLTPPLLEATAYHAELVQQSAREVNVTPGTTLAFEVTLKNTGSTYWDDDLVHLATNLPQDRIPALNKFSRSAIETSGWLSSNRIRLQERRVEPGKVGTFRFTYSVPSDAPFGIYEENFRPVADGITFMEELEVGWLISVVPPDTLPMS